MSFWNLNDGSAIDTNGEFEISGGDLEPIPNNTGCIAAIEEAKWDEYEGDRYISLKWRIMRPAEYCNRVIYHKVKVYGMANDKDPQATADKAKWMLAAIDTNAGGKLRSINGEPNDMQLMSALVGKTMAIKVLVWEFNDKKGNWIAAVSPAEKQEAPTAAPAQQSTPTPNVFEDDIPF